MHRPDGESTGMIFSVDKRSCRACTVGNRIFADLCLCIAPIVSFFPCNVNSIVCERLTRARQPNFSSFSLVAVEVAFATGVLG